MVAIWRKKPCVFLYLPKLNIEMPSVVAHFLKYIHVPHVNSNASWYGTENSGFQSQK